VLVRLAWAGAVLAVVGAILDTAVTAAYLPLMSERTWAEHGWPLVTLAALGSALMGALIVSRHPRHAIGWLLCLAGTTSISMPAESYSIWVLEHDGPGPALWAHVAAWVSVLLSAPLAITALTLIFLSAPDGRLLSRRWRVAAGAALTGLVLYWAGLCTLSPTTFSVDAADTGPVTSGLTSVGVVLLALALGASVVCLALRLRRDTGEVRRQLLWLAASGACLCVSLLFLLVLQAIVPREQGWLVALPLFASYALLPIATAVAVLRHRLFDIEVIINRAVALGLATATVAVGYVLLVVVIGRRSGPADGGFWRSLLATAVVALAFQPLRSQVLRLADRIAYGVNATPYDALADFSRRLGESTDPRSLLPLVAEAASTAVGAQSVTARLCVAGGPDRVADWPPGALPARPGPQVDLQVRDGDDVLGSVTVVAPPGRAFRPQDTLLLSDLVDSAVVAFRNARASAVLIDRVQELDRSTRELADSRRRLVDAGDAERRRLGDALAVEVFPHLEPLPVELAQLGADTGSSVTPERIAHLVDGSTRALEALREITRGVFPTQLTRTGLDAALLSLLGRTRVGRLTVEEAAAGRRYDAHVEAAAYFCVAEAARALTPPLHVALSASGDDLRMVVTGGHGEGFPLANVRDRVEAAGGTMTAVVVHDGVRLELRAAARSADLTRA
jgi:signal transduction histidine kinase